MIPERNARTFNEGVVVGVFLVLLPLALVMLGWFVGAGY